MSASSPLARCARPFWLGLAVCWAATATGCSAKPLDVTGLVVTIEMNGVAADQLRIGVTTSDGEVVRPQLRPDTPNGQLASPQSVSIFLPDSLATDMVGVTCTVTPFASNLPAGLAASAGPVKLTLHQLVPVTIRLGASQGDGGVPDGGGDAAGAGGQGGGAGGASGAGGAGGGAGAKVNGIPCASDGECDSMLCRDGVCCASACGLACQACNVPGKIGTCSPLPPGATPSPTALQQCAGQPATSCGYDGTCDGFGACKRYAPGIACKAASCNGSSYVPASACDGQGNCVASSPVECAPFACSTTGAPACLSTCGAAATDCVAPAVCNAGSCGMRPKKDNGAGCVADADCTSTHCADGVCCATTCSGACTSCKLIGTEGKCTAVGAGKADPHGVCKDQGATTCGKNGLCDAAGTCAYHPATTTCGAGSCNKAILQPAKHCDGKGACVTPTELDCMAYRCDPATTACFMSCTIAALQCAQRHACMNNACQ